MNTVPKLLDLYCCGGGAAVGYHRAGFRVYGIDTDPKPLKIYPYPSVCMEALAAMDELLSGRGIRFSNGETLYLRDVAAIHASPPCQFASKIARQNRSRRPDTYDHPNLIEPTRQRLVASGKPYVIENVPPAAPELIAPVKLCGSWFGLDLHRHRYFESNLLLMGAPCCHDWQKPRFRSLDQRRAGKLTTVVGVHGHINYTGEFELRQKAMGIDWMSNAELSQAIPPAYTEFIGNQIMAAIRSSIEPENTKNKECLFMTGARLNYHIDPEKQKAWRNRPEKNWPTFPVKIQRRREPIQTINVIAPDSFAALKFVEEFHRKSKFDVIYLDEQDYPLFQEPQKDRTENSLKKNRAGSRPAFNETETAVHSPTGERRGRPRAGVTVTAICDALKQHRGEPAPVKAAARALGVSRGYIYKYVPAEKVREVLSV